MSSLFEKLAQLEFHIQALVERGAASSLSKAGNFGRSMVAAMEGSIKADDSGRSTAADLYIVSVDPKTAHLLLEDQSLVDEFSQMIYEAGKESGIQFSVPPRVKINSDPSLEAGNFTISAQFSLQEVDETSALTIASDSGPDIPEHAFLIIKGVQIYPLDESVINLGRRSDNHVVIDDMRVSRVHAQIRAVKGHYVIFDLDSSGGTYVNGVHLTQATLYPGDVISLAGVDLVYGQVSIFIRRQLGFYATFGTISWHRCIDEYSKIYERRNSSLHPSGDGSGPVWILGLGDLDSLAGHQTTG